ncbi:flap endonuclease GEN homolog 1-like [Ruditapes philippinarum]|uniref:flap endonuclease GEN homolog 1-like n=1 Tax=Ruditapes philippinarum TaxID=129788 RepID=UPI00295B2E76|nr:flap endonuclease GEN homolog 1-like [Ruditapes philippinarum]
MGVHTLWNILEDSGENSITIRSLKGKKLAVDLSAWIVELKQSKFASQYHNIYIRNLFYRTIEFMKEGVELVFVTDGRAPDIKQQALLKRQQNQFGSSSNTVNTDRPYLRNAVSQCVEMLEYLGLSCVESSGEAEALCAELNRKQLVDGCLTEDNDFFLYGGKTLYRKLTKNNKMYLVDRVDMDQIKSDLDLDRSDLVALALLLGSDYDEKGVKCIGKEKGKALIKLLKSRNFNPLDRLQGWRENKELDHIQERLSVETKKECHCSKCDHLGRISAHESSGCKDCGMEIGCQDTSIVTCNCPWHKQEAVRKQHKLEVTLRQKSLENVSFPNKMVIEEYLNPGLKSCSEIQKSSINVPKLLTFLKHHLGWQSEEVLGKMVPIVILKEMREAGSQPDLMFTPVRILRACKENHVDCYEVLWDKTDRNHWAGASFSTNIKEKVEKSLFQTVYPVLAAKFEQELTEKKSGSGKKRKAEGLKVKSNLQVPKKIKRKKNFTILLEKRCGPQKEDFLT